MYHKAILLKFFCLHETLIRNSIRITVPCYLTITIKLGYCHAYPIMCYAFELGFPSKLILK